MKRLFFILLVLIAIKSQAQKVIDYHNPEGKVGSHVTDYLNIDFLPVGNSKSNSTILPGLIGAVSSAALDIYNAIHDKKIATYSANTTNSICFSFNKDQLSTLNKGEYNLVIKRFGVDALTSQPDPNNLLEQYIILIKSNHGLLQLQLTGYNIYRSKAFVKNDDKLAIGLDITFTPGASANKSSNVTNAARNTQQTTKSKTKKKEDGQSKNNKAIDSLDNKNADDTPDDGKDSKNSTAGEGVITIPLVQTSPNQSIIDVSGIQMINKIFIPGPTLSDDQSEALFTVTVKVTELNESRLDNSTVNQILKTNSSDITSVIKAIFSNSSNSTGKK